MQVSLYYDLEFNARFMQLDEPDESLPRGGLGHFKCLECNNRTTYGFSLDFVYDEPDAYLIAYYCNPCKLYYAACSKCSNEQAAILCNIISIETNSEEYFEDLPFYSIKEHDCPTGSHLVTYTRDFYYVNDNIFREGSLTGTDGGLASYWKCSSCSKILEYNDK